MAHEADHAHPHAPEPAPAHWPETVPMPAPPVCLTVTVVLDGDLAAQLDTEELKPILALAAHQLIAGMSVKEIKRRLNGYVPAEYQP